MDLLLIPVIAAWWGMVVGGRRRALGPGPATSIRDRRARPEVTSEDADHPWTRPTRDDVQGWLALALVVVLVFALAQSAAPPQVRGLALVAGFLLVAVHEERTTRAGRPRTRWMPGPARHTSPGHEGDRDG